ncbi:MAG: L,D-transpeptidase [Actinobacteria bacterium]|nr:L,D-transpeptidase [Actinomycetota bacterium]
MSAGPRTPVEQRELNRHRPAPPPRSRRRPSKAVARRRLTLVIFVGLGLAVGIGWAIPSQGGGELPGRDRHVSPARPTMHAAAEPAAGVAEDIQVTSVTPPVGSPAISPLALFTIETSKPVAPGTLHPQLSPQVQGTWSQPTPTEIVFAPSRPLPFGSTETLTLPFPSASSNRPSQGNTLFQATYHVSGPSVVLAQLLLSELGYLPLRVVGPPGSVPVTNETSSSAANLQGYFSWRWPDLPAALKQAWEPGVDTVLTKGAVISFERVHGLTTGSWPMYAGTMGPQFWSTLLSASSAGQYDPFGFSYALVTKDPLPERITVWHEGQVVLTSPVNTGIPGGATPDGTFPVYQRYRSQTMHGFTATGAPYVYPNVQYVNYFKGNFAIHAFKRAAYGFPQSQGCVELPIAAAATAWNYLHYGTLVTVSGHVPKGAP